MPHFFLKLNPCRPTFTQDMNDQERAIMQQHVAPTIGRDQKRSGDQHKQL